MRTLLICASVLVLSGVTASAVTSFTQEKDLIPFTLENKTDKNLMVLTNIRNLGGNAFAQLQPNQTQTQNLARVSLEYRQEYFFGYGIIDSKKRVWGGDLVECKPDLKLLPPALHYTLTINQDGTCVVK